MLKKVYAQKCPTKFGASYWIIELITPILYIWLKSMKLLKLAQGIWKQKVRICYSKKPDEIDSILLKVGPGLKTFIGVTSKCYYTDVTNKDISEKDVQKRSDNLVNKKML